VPQIKQVRHRFETMLHCWNHPNFQKLVWEIHRIQHCS